MAQLLGKIRVVGSVSFPHKLSCAHSNILCIDIWLNFSLHFKTYTAMLIFIPHKHKIWSPAQDITQVTFTPPHFESTIYLPIRTHPVGNLTLFFTYKYLVKIPCVGTLYFHAKAALTVWKWCQWAPRKCLAFSCKTMKFMAPFLPTSEERTSRAWLQ